MLESEFSFNVCKEYIGDEENLRSRKRKSHAKEEIGVCWSRVDPQVPDSRSQSWSNDEGTAHYKLLLHNWKNEKVSKCSIFKLGFVYILNIRLSLMVYLRSFLY